MKRTSIEASRDKHDIQAERCVVSRLGTRLKFLRGLAIQRYTITSRGRAARPASASWTLTATMEMARTTSLIAWNFDAVAPRIPRLRLDHPQWSARVEL